MKPTRLVFCMVFLASMQLMSQKDLRVLTSNRDIGTHLKKGTKLSCSTYVFPDRIYDFQVDTLTQQMTLELRGLSKNGKWLNNKGTFLRYNADQEEITWAKKVNYRTGGIEQFGHVTLETKTGKSFCLDSGTGKELWEVKNSMIFASEEHNIGLGYKLTNVSREAEQLQGIDLTTGKAKWERFITREYGWSDVHYLNDSTLMIVAGGLHTLNIKNGKGWDYYTTTGKKDRTASAVGTGLGVVAGLLTGTYGVSTGYDLVGEVNSNVLRDSTEFYFASSEHLVKLSARGAVTWQKALPNELTSKSKIFMHQDKLIVVNLGYAYMGRRKKNFGTPFIASYDKVSGQQEYLVELTNEKKESINTLDIQEDGLVLIFDDRVERFDLAMGQLIKTGRLNTEKYGTLGAFIGDQAFVKNENGFSSLPKEDTSKIYLLTSKRKVVALNQDFEVVDELEVDDLFLNKLLWNSYTFLVKDDKTWIVNIDGQTVAEAELGSNSMLHGDVLYSIDDTTLIAVDLNQLSD